MDFPFLFAAQFDVKNTHEICKADALKKLTILEGIGM